MSEREDNDGYRPYSAPSTIVPYFYFAGAALELILHRDLSPDYIVCHDWHTGGSFGFTRLLERIKNKKKFKTLFMVHNYEFQGDLHEDIYQYLDSDAAAQLEDIFSRHKRASLLALALKNSDYAATVSHSYARELVDGRAPHIGLNYLDLRNREMLSFLNGSDSTSWRPETSPYLPVPYGVDTLERKKDIKKIILERYRFNNPGDTHPPLVLMLCRLTAQKGIELFTGNHRELNGSIKNMEMLLEQGNRILICGNPGGGTGGIIDNDLSNLQEKFPGRFCYLNYYSDELAHHLLAGADILLAPSLFEPCGLIQIYAMAFGTVPVVRSVGGMRDTVRCYFEEPGIATGFYMNDFSRDSLQATLRSAVGLYYREPVTWRRLMERGMAADFSWTRMSRQYFHFFDRLEGGGHP
ncbi:MAG: glycosyltransferase, partial [bacterium]|nr:glycosyltransferase [bacterium]